MSDMSDVKPLTKLDSARMRALRNGIYHTLRRSFYERAEKVLNFLVIALGTATAADLGEHLWTTNSVLYTGLLTAFVGTLQMVWGPGMKARDHAVLQGRFYSLVARCEGAAGREDEIAMTIEQEMVQIYADETQTMHAVNALAYNAAQSANGRPPEARLNVKLWQRLVANIVAFSPDDFKPKRQNPQQPA